MQRCRKVNNTTIWWLRKINETNYFKVKTLSGFNLAFLKVSTSTIRELKFLQSDLTLNLLLPPIVTLWHDHVQVLNLQTPSLFGFTPTQAALLATLRSHSFRSPSVMILMQQLCSIKCLIVVFALVDSCVIRRYKTSQIS